MRRAALAFAIALTATSPGAAQGVNPAPGAAPAPGMNAPPPANPRRNANPAESVAAACDQGLPADMRKCKQKNVADLQKALNRKIAEACQKQSSVGRGGPAADERLACRFDMLTKLIQSIN